MTSSSCSYIHVQVDESVDMCRCYSYVPEYGYGNIVRLDSPYLSVLRAASHMFRLQNKISPTNTKVNRELVIYRLMK
jgi:hypothetical protein